jgi:hypothetical protein
MREFLELVGTSIEGGGGGITAAFVNKLSKNLTNNDTANFFLEHGITAAGGGVAFALLATGITFGLMYEEEKKKHPLLTPKKFAEEKAGEACKFALKVFFFGAVAFDSFTSLIAYLPSLNINEFAVYGISIAVGLTLFTSGNIIPFMRAPIQKIAEVGGVFTGFAAGIYLASKNPNSWYSAYLPTILCATSAFVVSGSGALLRKFGICGSSPTKSLDPENPAINETTPLIPSVAGEFAPTALSL